MAEIVLDKITKRYGDGYEAVHNADFTIGDGEFFILVGPSGCGKSTLLNMIVGLEDITSGRLMVDGDDMTDVDPKDRNMAMVFQSYAIYPHMTVRENMAFPLKLRKLPADEIKRKVDEAARTLELTDHLERKPANLSGGQRQRVAMGRAIVREPNVFLMDEPLSNLDAKLRVQMRTQLARLQQRLGTTTIYVTHDQTEAMTLGDRVAVMRKGVVQQIGPPKHLYDWPANLFVAGFIGSPAMNFLPATVNGDRITVPMFEADLPPDLAERLPGDGDYVAGVRPEHFEDAALIGEQEVHGATFSTTVEVLESMGSDLYVHFEVEGTADISSYADELASPKLAADDRPTSEVVARLDPASTAAEGKELKLWLDTRHMQLFDPRTGENVSVRSA